MIPKTNCRHFRNDRPCIFHKEAGAVCDTCGFFSPYDTKILIVKLDAMGDVLRTTCILPGLKEKYPDSFITWITKKDSLPLLGNNPFVDAVFSVEEDALFVLESEEFDLVLNPDAAPLSARLAAVACGSEKLGFVFHKRGYVVPVNSEAEKWFLMGINDDLKKLNLQTYQRIILEICRLQPSNYDMVYCLTGDEKEFAEAFAKEHGITGPGPVIGLNTGAGGRWSQKKWTRDGYLSLISLLMERIPNATILLYGGPEEKARNFFLERKAGNPSVIDTGCGHSLRRFAALLSLPDVVVTGDTLAMHIVLALRRKLVVLFGPTSFAEIDLYNRGEKIYPDMDCLVCYNGNCHESPTCMESIHPETVLKAIERMLA